jgi:hypothetical protein
MGMDALVQVLGPLEVRVGEDVLDLGGTRIRTLLAMLVANAGPGDHCQHARQRAVGG